MDRAEIQFLLEKNREAEASLRITSLMFLKTIEEQIIFKSLHVLFLKLMK